MKKWLVEFKFKDWIKHKTEIKVTKKEKIDRASEIASKLADNKIWHSHGRLIGINTVRNVLKLKIHDYSKDPDLSSLIRNYHDFINEFLIERKISNFFHTRKT